MAKDGPKSPKSDFFFDFQSDYTQNDRNFALVLNFSLIFGKKLPNRQKWPKMAKKVPKSPKSDFF